jgi:diphthine synthase
MVGGIVLHKLIFIGLGLWDERDMGEHAREALRASDTVFVEFYTSKLCSGALERLESAVGKRFERLNRMEVESNDRVLKAFSEAKEGLVVSFCCAGDPLTATTHQDLRIRAHQKGISVEIIPGPSIMTAAPALAGLSIYKFGRTTTVPFPQEDFFPQSPYEVIRDNKRSGCHSLVLLDIDAEHDRYMSANEGLKVLLELESRLKDKAVTPGTIAVVVARAGSPEPLVRAGTVGSLIQEDFGPPLHCLMFPGNLHFMEEDALVEIGGAKREDMK